MTIFTIAQSVSDPCGPQSNFKCQSTWKTLTWVLGAFPLTSIQAQ